MRKITVRSPAFEDHGPIPPEYSHDAGDLCPPLLWTGAPTETAELVLICEDPDVADGAFVHWLLAGLPPQIGGIAGGDTGSPGVPGTNDYGRKGYGGPHPPAGDDPHHYHFRLYALDGPSELRPGFDTGQLMAVIGERAIGAGSLVGTFSR